MRRSNHQQIARHCLKSPVIRLEIFVLDEGEIAPFDGHCQCDHRQNDHASHHGLRFCPRHNFKAPRNSSRFYRQRRQKFVSNYLPPSRRRILPYICPPTGKREHLFCRNPPSASACKFKHRTPSFESSNCSFTGRLHLMFDVQRPVFDVSFCFDRAVMPSGSMCTSTSLTAGMASRILSFTSWAILCERRTVICRSTL